MSTSKFVADETFGCDNEARLLECIQNAYGNDMRRCAYKFSPFDFESDSCVVELKSRRCRKDTYQDTMVGANKIEKMLKDNRRCYCVFSFTDGVFSVEVTVDSVKQFRFSEGGRCDRGRVERRAYAFIPARLLEGLPVPLCPA